MRVSKTKKMVRFEARYRRQLRACGFRSQKKAQERRSALIDKSIAGETSEAEELELERLQILVGYYADWKTNDDQGRMNRRLNRMMKRLGIDL